MIIIIIIIIIIVIIIIIIIRQVLYNNFPRTPTASPAFVIPYCQVRLGCMFWLNIHVLFERFSNELKRGRPEKSGLRHPLLPGAPWLMLILILILISISVY